MAHDVATRPHQSPVRTAIGIAAPILLLTMRVIQGFSLGGEFTGSMVST